jgi:phenol 2-monooxygenase
MQLPENWTGDPKADPNEVLGHVMKEAATFSSGLGIYYEPDTYLNLAQVSGITSISAGQRAPDVPLQKPATFEATRLQVETPNTATFYIALFAGDVAHTKHLLAEFTEAVSKLSWLFDSDLPIEWLSIFPGPGGPSAFETLGGMPFGRVFYDEDHSAHQRYGIDIQKGAVFVLRPDGWVGTVVSMDDGAAGKLENYFSRFLIGATSTPSAKL